MDGIAITDMKGVVQYTNMEWARMHGYAEDKIVGTMIKDFFPEHVREDVNLFMPKSNEAGVYQGDISHVTKEECIFNAWTTSALITDQKGKKTGILWTARKIESQDESENLYEKLAKSSYTSIYIVQDGKIKYLNHVGEEIGGLGADEIIEREDSLSFIHPDDRERVRANAIQMLKGERTAPYEFRCVGRDGSIRWLIESVTSIHYKGSRAFLGNAMDITALKEARSKIEEYEDLASSILDAAPHAIFGLEDRKIIFANDGVEAVFGWKPEELVGQSTKILYPTTKDFEKMGEMGYGTLEKERTFTASEYPCRHKDGRAIICRVDAARIGDSLTSRKIVATYEDITEQIKARERLRESEELYRSLSEGSFAGVYLVQKGKFRYINTKAASYAGYRPKELIGRKSYCIVHPDDRNKVKRCESEMLKGRRDSPFEFRIVTKKKGVRWIMETVNPISFEGKQAVLGNSMDITELKEAQTMIEEHQDLESSILDATPHAIFVLEDRKIIFANGSVEAVFGWKPEELVGQSTKILYPTTRDFEKMGQIGYGTLEKERTFTTPEYPCRCKDGRTIICRVHAARIGDSLTSRRIVATYEDITEQKKAEDTLRQRTQELENKTQNLEETNIALKVLLKRIEEDRVEMEESVVKNVKELVMPCIEKIKTSRIDHKMAGHVSMLESTLMSITSPYMHRLSSKFLNLTPTETYVANLLKDGKTSKEIAEVLNITVRGVEFHRNKIRMKLGIKNKKVNLRSHLLSVAIEK